MAERSYRGLLWGLVLVGTTLDQVSKYAVFKWLYNGGTEGQREIIPGAFRLLAQFTDKHESSGHVLAFLRTWSADVLPVVNKGALFGMRLWLDGMYDWLPNVVFTVVSILAALAITYWSTRPSTARDRYLCAALGLILAGTLGNLYDRLVFFGVRDFLHFYLIDWPVFNLADCCLVCGASLLLAQAFWGHPVSKPHAENAEMALSTATAEAK